jgi:hypothetical protein
MKKLFLLLVLMMIPLVMQATSPTISATRGDQLTFSSTSTYVNSQDDTVSFTREKDVAAYAFYIFTYDSTAFGGTIAGKVLRYTNNCMLTAIGADTLDITYKASTAANGWRCWAGTIIVSSATQPLCDVFKVVVTWASTGNGGDGTASNYVKYAIEKQYYTKP